MFNCRQAAAKIIEVELVTQTDKAARFRALHESDDGFIMPNPWDVGSAKLLASIGFKALATTSSGFARSIGLGDGAVGLERKIKHCRILSTATDLPVSADLENGFADDPEGAAHCITLAAQAGVVGGSLEDFSGKKDQSIYEFSHAVERVAAAVEAAKALPFDFLLTARAENFLHGRPDLDDTIARLQAFEKAGADVLYAPGLTTMVEVRQVLDAVSKPVNVLAVMMQDGSIAELLAAGVKRISIGGAMANAAQGALLRAGRQLMADGGMNWLQDAASATELEALMKH